MSGIFKTSSPFFPVDSNGWTRVLDLQPLAISLTLDIVTEMLYDHSVHGQNPQKRSQLAAELDSTDLADPQDFLTNLNRVGELIGFSALFGILSLLSSIIRSVTRYESIQTGSPAVDWIKCPPQK